MGFGGLLSSTVLQVHMLPSPHHERPIPARQCEHQSPPWCTPWLRVPSPSTPPAQQLEKTAANICVLVSSDRPPLWNDIGSMSLLRFRADLASAHCLRHSVGGTKQVCKGSREKKEEHTRSIVPKEDIWCVELRSHLFSDWKVLLTLRRCVRKDGAGLIS